MENAHRLYGDLHEAQGNLVLLNHLHLLYVVTPYSMVDQIKYVHQVYFTVVSICVNNFLQFTNITFT